MYVCGPTTYDYSHLGHARSYIAFDTARRYLESLGLRVAYVQNFTDIEEVIIQRAAQAGKPPLEFSQFFIDAFLEDMRALNVRAARVARRVQRHGVQVPRGPPRYPWRRPRPDVPPPRERSDDLRGGLGRRLVANLDAQRVPHAGTGEDVEEPRQLRDDSGGLAGLSGRSRPALSAEESLPRECRV